MAQPDELRRLRLRRLRHSATVQRMAEDESPDAADSAWQSKLDALLLLELVDTVFPGTQDRTATSGHSLAETGDSQGLAVKPSIDVIVEFAARPSTVQRGALASLGVLLPLQGTVRGRFVAATIPAAVVRDLASLSCVRHIRRQTSRSTS
jgi:hypothetical protein